MNKLIISGNLCQEMELKTTQNGKEVLTNCIAVRRDFKGPNGEYESDFINIVAWGPQATYLNNYAHKGDRAEAVGRLQKRQYQAQDGSTRDVYECVLESITVFSKQPNQQQTNNKPTQNQQQTNCFYEDPNLPF